MKRLGKSGDGIMIVVATRPMKVLQSKVMNYSFYPLQRCYRRLSASTNCQKKCLVDRGASKRFDGHEV